LKFIKLNSASRNTLSDSTTFESKLRNLFKSTENHSIELHFFQFGLKWESIHYKDKASKFKIPTIEKFKGKIDIELIVSIQLGRNKIHELNEREAEKYDKFFWRISRAKKFDRPNWAYFYFWGNLIGALNSNQINLERFNQYFDELPSSIIQKNRIQLESLFNHFNEIGLTIKINDKNKPAYNIA